MTGLPTRRLGRTQANLCAIGLGGAWWGAAGRDETVRGIELALELGMDFFDTYPGQQEQAWGEVLAVGDRRQNVFLQAKVSSHVRNDRRSDHSAAATRRSIEASLTELDTDYLDCALIHGYDQLSDTDGGAMLDPLGPGNALDELLKLKAAGVVRHIGIGARSADVHRRALETGQIDVVLTYLEYNLLTQAAGTELFPLCRAHDVGVILASPLGMGLLTGAEPDAGDERRKIRDTVEPRAHSMWAWCQQRGVDIRHLAIQYCLQAPVDGIVLPGQASAAQVRDTYEAATMPIAADVWRDFEDVFSVGIE